MMPSKTQLMTVGLAVLAIAVISRVEPAREIVFNERKFLGIF